MSKVRWAVLSKADVDMSKVTPAIRNAVNGAWTSARLSNNGGI